jgi:DNA-binding NtrC family response regulator
MCRVYVVSGQMVGAMPLRLHPVCVVEDDERMRRSIEDLLLSAGHLVETFSSGAAFLERNPGSEPGCLILDVVLPGLDGLQLQSKLRESHSTPAIIFVTAHGDIASCVRAIKAGAMEYFTKPFDPDALLAAVERAVRPTTLGSQVDSKLGVIGRSPILRRILDDVAIVAPTETTVLVRGETGTGKELVAQAVHLQSRRKGALVKVNCAALPASLLESELMGHEKGAFTGAASKRIGRFEAAHDGTIFLDEIGEMPLELQPKMLRLLQERVFERLGSNQSVHTTARVVAATNRDLRAMTAERTFREDLYYRLNVFPVELPPLRERREDIPDLAQHFAETFARRAGKHIEPISDELMTRLCAYDWPGNIRELMNLIERAVILARDGVLPLHVMVAMAPDREHGARDRVPSTTVPTPVKPRKRDQRDEADNLDDVQRQHILSVLESTNWVIGGPRGAATRLGVKRPTLLYRMKKLGIERSDRDA